MTVPTFGDVRSAYQNNQILPELWYCVPEAVEYLRPKESTLHLIMPDLFTDGAIRTLLRLEGMVGERKVTYAQWNDKQTFDFFSELVRQIQRHPDGGPGDYKATWQPHRALGAHLPPDEIGMGALRESLRRIIYQTAHSLDGAAARAYDDLARVSPDPAIALRAMLSGDALRVRTAGTLDRLCRARYDLSSSSPMFGTSSRLLPMKMSMVVGVTPNPDGRLYPWPGDTIEVVMNNPPGWSVKEQYAKMLWAARGIAAGKLPPVWRKMCGVMVEVAS